MLAPKARCQVAARRAVTFLRQCPGRVPTPRFARIRGGRSVCSPLAVQSFLVLARDAGDAQRRTTRPGADPLDAAGIEHMPTSAWPERLVDALLADAGLARLDTSLSGPLLLVVRVVNGSKGWYEGGMPPRVRHTHRGRR
jgi:hypothetical protein